MIYTWKKESAGVTKFIPSSIYAMNVDGRVYTLAYVNSKDGYKFKPIAGACKDKSFYTGNFTTNEEAIDNMLKQDYTVYEFGNENEFHGWLAQIFAAPAAEPKEKKIGGFTAHILEDKIASMDRIFGKKIEELGVMVGKLQADKYTEPRPISLQERIADLEKQVGNLHKSIYKQDANAVPAADRDTTTSTQKRSDGYYIVSYPVFGKLRCCAQSKNNIWYLPGTEEPYKGYLIVHSKVDLHA